MCSSDLAVIDVDPDQPKSLADADERRRRMSLLHEDHVAPLTAFVERLRAERGVGREIPYFDPLDGGVDARALLLLEAPGPKAVQSGFVSRNNPDETAKNFLLACRDAGLDRRQTVVWNIVPWYIGDGKKIRRAGVRDLHEGLPFLLARLIPMLHRLQAVVLIGGKADRAYAWIRPPYPNLRIFHCPHPSPVFVNRHPGNRTRVVGALAQVVLWLNSIEADLGEGCCKLGDA